MMASQPTAATTTRDQRVAQYIFGRSRGGIFLAIGGAFWFGVGLGPASVEYGWTPWALVIVVMVAGLAYFIRASLALAKRSGFTRRDLGGSRRQFIRGWLLSGLLESALVGGAVLLCRMAGRDDLMWPAIAIAVSAHFASIAYLFDVPLYYKTAAAGVVVSTIVLLAPLGDARLPALALTMTPVMWGSAYLALRRAEADAGAWADRSAR